MTKTCSLKSVFERLSCSNRVLTPFGVYFVVRTRIHIIEVGSCFAVALYKYFEHNGVYKSCVVARSYPMSYKSAYRLVCSL